MQRHDGPGRRCGRGRRAAGAIVAAAAQDGARARAHEQQHGGQACGEARAQHDGPAGGSAEEPGAQGGEAAARTRPGSRADRVHRRGGGDARRPALRLDVGEPHHDAPQRRHLGGEGGVVALAALQGGRLVGGQLARDVRDQVGLAGHAAGPSSASSRSRNRASPRTIRVLTVPRAIPVASAISACVSPS